MAGILFYTLGCKLNQLETESLADAFRREGFAIADWEAPPDGVCILVVNTCTVTSHAEQKARRTIRKALKGSPQGIVIITGCYAQMEAKALEDEFNETADKNARRIFVIPGERKAALLDLPALLNSAPCGFPASENDELAFLREKISEWAQTTGWARDSFRFSPLDFTFHSRAFVKIQDGCDNKCSFCRVNLARGKSRSRDAGELVKYLRALEEKGCVEAVLTGVNISQFSNSGPGLSLSLSLGGLLLYLVSGTEKIRFRLSSLESSVFDDQFLCAVSSERLRPHFHLSVQSGSPAVLGRMGRAGSLERFDENIRRLREIRGDPFLACDIITGFPGETDEDFEKTFEFCERHSFAWIHVFPFSRRPGTAAWNFKGRVSEREAGIRAGRLAELACKGKSEYISRWTGKEVEFVPEKAKEKNGPRFLSGVSSNYLKLCFKGEERTLLPGEILRCKITGEANGAEKKHFDAQGEII